MKLDVWILIPKITKKVCCQFEYNYFAICPIDIGKILNHTISLNCANGLTVITMIENDSINWYGKLNIMKIQI